MLCWLFQLSISTVCGSVVNLFIHIPLSLLTLPLSILSRRPDNTNSHVTSDPSFITHMLPMILIRLHSKHMHAY